MRKSKEKPYGPFLERLMSEKTKLLSQAQAFAQMGLTETAQPLWRSAASLEERIAPRLDALGRSREAALHRISAATCHRNAGQFSQAANLFQGALAGPLNEATRADVEQFLDECLAELETSSSSRSGVAL
jgi:hypothetical protein